MKDDWYAITPRQKYAPPYAIEWSPSGLVRAKHNKDHGWKTTKCSKACYAESIGYSLLKGGCDETMSNLPHCHVPQR